MYPVPSNDYASQFAAIQAQLAQPLHAVPQLFNQQPEQIRYVDGIAGAKELQSKLPPNSSAVVMDKNDDIFYVIQKDEKGDSPKRMQIGRFTLEAEESAEPEYVTKKDFEAFEQRMVALLGKGTVINE